MEYHIEKLASPNAVVGEGPVWNSAEKKGYSGVAILSKIKPKNITFGFGNDKFDSEGRFFKG